MLSTRRASLIGTSSRRTGGTDTTIVAAICSGILTSDNVNDSDSSTQYFSETSAASIWKHPS